MAADLDLLSQLTPGSVAIRTYTWSDLWVTLGRFQTAETTLRDPSETPYIVRPTGGKAVLHGHDATVGIAFAWEGKSGESRALRKLYRALITPLAEALSACGRPAVLAEERQGAVREDRLSPDCFFGTSQNDVVDPESGQKVCGCALRVWSDRVLLQASIPAGTPRRTPAEVFRPPFHELPTATWDPSNLADALQAAFLRRTVPK